MTATPRAAADAHIAATLALGNRDQDHTGDLLRHLPLLNLIPAAIYICDVHGVIRYFNSRAAALWQRSPRIGDSDERFCGAFRLHTVSGDPLPHARTPMARAIQTRSPAIDDEAVIERPDGSRITVLVNISPIFDEHGTFLGAINCFQEITQRKQREIELARLQRNLEDFFQNGPIGLHTVGPDGAILRANRAELDLLGYAPEEYIGRNVAEFHVDQEVIEDILARLARNEIVRNYECRLRARDGSIRHVLVSSSALWVDGEFVHTRCFTQDITRRKHAEEALQRSESMFRQLADAMPQIVWTARPDGTVDYHNRRWYELTNEPEGLEGDHAWTPALHPDDRQRSIDRWNDAVQSGQPYEIECRLRNGRTGEYRWHLGRALPVRDEHGNIVRWFGTATDIEDLKRAESELAHQAALLSVQADELAQSNADLEDFAYISSHDLKEPLRGISNYASMLLKDVGDQVDDDARDKLHALVRLSQRMYKLLDALLEYSRIGRSQPALEETDIGALAAEIVDTLRPRFESENVAINIQPGLPTVKCDRARVGQLFTNLIVNAIKYNESPQRIVEIGAVEGGVPGHTPVFFVRDNGIGIRLQHCQSIFRIFRRLHHRHEFGGGDGVGLSLAKRIVERHGGRIWVESTPGEGSTFCFTITSGRGETYDLVDDHPGALPLSREVQTVAPSAREPHSGQSAPGGPRRA